MRKVLYERASATIRTQRDGCRLVRLIRTPDGAPHDTTGVRTCITKENVIVDRGGFRVARKATHASDGDWRPLIGMLEQLPIRPESLAADTGYNDGRLRKHLKDLGITAYIPVHPNQERSMVTKGGFDYRGDHLVCSEGKRLDRAALVKKDRQYQYLAHQKDCQQCPVNTE